MPAPWFGVANNELGASVGALAICPNCGEYHPVKYGERVMPDGTKQPSRLLAFVDCGGKSYLVAVAGRLLPARKRRDSNGC